MHFHRDVIAVCDCFPRYVLKPEPRRHLLRLAAASPSPTGSAGWSSSRCGSALRRCCWSRPRRRSSSRASRTTAPRSASPRRPRTAPCWPMLEEHDISSLRNCVSAGEHLPLPTFEAWEQATGLRIIDGIGATEMLHIFISASGDEHPSRRHGQRRPRLRGADRGRRRPRGSARNGRQAGRAGTDRLPLPGRTSSGSAATCSTAGT